MIYSILYIFLIINILIQLGYWGVLFSKFDRQVFTASSANAAFAGISIVVCAKNEAENLTKNLLYILQQNYNIFEVIVVNDGSEDDTLRILQKFSNDFAHLKIITIDKNAPKILQGKKNALTAGIAAAAYDWILVTDADCRPRSEFWAADMMRTAISENKQMVLGYSPLGAKTSVLAEKTKTLSSTAENENTSIFEYFFCIKKYIAKTKVLAPTWSRLETIYTALQYVSFANWGLPYMGVGRNMLYHKNLFVANGGVAAHADLLSGDDDLFVRDVATAANTTVCLSANSIVDSAAKETWRAYAKQKTRHLSTSVRYKPLIQLLLGVLSASHLLVYFFAVCLVLLKTFFADLCITKGYAHGYTHFILLLLLFLRWLVQILQLIRVSNILQEKNIRKYVFLFDFMLFLYLFVMSFSFLKKEKKW